MTIDSSLLVIVRWIDLLGISVVLTGIVTGFSLFALAELRRLLRGGTATTVMTSTNRARAQIAVYLLLALDLMIGSDIIISLLDPDLEALVELGGVVAVRTVLSFFLGKELQEIERNEDSVAPGPGASPRGPSGLPASGT